jgi:hypothetical protein
MGSNKLRNLILLAKYRGQWKAVVKETLDCQAAMNVENVLTNCVAVGLSRRSVYDISWNLFMLFMLLQQRDAVMVL